MSKHRRLKTKEIVLLCLPVLLFALWALATHEVNVRENIGGTWHGPRGVVEFRVRGDELIARLNGKIDSHMAYRFINDNTIEVTDSYVRKNRSKPLIYPIKVRIRRGILEWSTQRQTARARRIGD